MSKKSRRDTSQSITDWVKRTLKRNPKALSWWPEAINERHLCHAIRICFEGELRKHAVAEVHKAVNKFQSTSGSFNFCDDTNPDDIMKACGLTFPIWTVWKWLFDRLATPISPECAIGMAACMEYMSAEILELSGNGQIGNPTEAIHCLRVLSSIVHDEELLKTLSRLQILGVGFEFEKLKKTLEKGMKAANGAKMKKDNTIFAASSFLHLDDAKIQKQEMRKFLDLREDSDKNKEGPVDNSIVIPIPYASSDLKRDKTFLQTPILLTLAARGGAMVVSKSVLKTMQEMAWRFVEFIIKNLERTDLDYQPETKKEDTKGLKIPRSKVVRIQNVLQVLRNFCDLEVIGTGASILDLETSHLKTKKEEQKLSLEYAKIKKKVEAMAATERKRNSNLQFEKCKILVEVHKADSSRERFYKMEYTDPIAEMDVKISAAGTHKDAALTVWRQIREKSIGGKLAIPMVSLLKLVRCVQESRSTKNIWHWDSAAIRILGASMERWIAETVFEAVVKVCSKHPGFPNENPEDITRLEVLLPPDEIKFRCMEGYIEFLNQGNALFG
ncbi:hypothetical protein AAMO2058_000182200 [Amorphochlora amoebiformis]